MTRHDALTRAAELIRLHMATPDAEVLAVLDEVAREMRSDWRTAGRERARAIIREARKQ